MEKSSGESVMVIESDHDTRVEIRRILEIAGYFVVSTGNGADAMSLLEKITAPTIILLSASLSLIPGAEFLKILRSHADYALIPVAQIANANEAELLGTRGILRKPIVAGEMLSLLEACRT